MDDIERIRRASKSPIPNAQVGDGDAAAVAPAASFVRLTPETVNASLDAEAVNNLVAAVLGAMDTLRAVAFAVGRCPTIDEAAFACDVIAGAAAAARARGQTMEACPPLVTMFVQELAIGALSKRKAS